VFESDAGESEVAKVTPEHPFGSVEHGWVAAGDLAVGDLVLTASGGWMQVAAGTWLQETATVYNLEVQGFHTYFVGEAALWVHNQCDECGGDGGKAAVPLPKFQDYIFKPGAKHGKDAVFKGLGYGREQSADLAKMWEGQAASKYAKGDYTLGKLDQYGQRIDIEIELNGIGDAAGKTSYLRSGWMIKPDGTIKLNTPFSGFTR